MFKSLFKSAKQWIQLFRRIPVSMQGNPECFGVFNNNPKRIGVSPIRKGFDSILDSCSGGNQERKSNFQGGLLTPD